jgi:tRNA A-37 threonylcarbamoyl transferase component Bud32
VAEIQLMEQLRAKFERLMDAPITGLRELAVNKYCRIVQGVINGELVVMKAYHAGERDLVRREADGIRLYEKLGTADGRFLPGRVLALDEEQRLLVMAFVQGRRLSDILREVARDRARWSEAEGLLRLAGEFLCALRAKTTLSGAEPDPFHEEYISHCSGRLRGLGLFGGLLFASAPEEAKVLWDRYRLAGTSPSTAHGDFVLRNLHVEGDRIGVIDFANTLTASHPLNDLYNMRQGMEAMWLPTTFVTNLWRSLQEGFGTESFPEADHAFFHEFHRRRWLMLNLGSRQPTRWLKAVRGLRGFAQPWEARRKGASP